MSEQDEIGPESDESDNDSEADADADSGKPMRFDIFVLSLNASTLIHLGEGQPSPGAGDIDLPLARQTIDILSLLEEKTRGNLSAEERQVLEQILYELRMRFVEITGGSQGSPGSQVSGSKIIIP